MFELAGLPIMTYIPNYICSFYYNLLSDIKASIYLPILPAVLRLLHVVLIYL